MPTEAEYEAMLSQVGRLQSAGRTEEAKAGCRDALGKAESAGEEVFIHLFRGQLALLDGDHRQDLAEVAEAARLAPDSAFVNTEMGFALYENERYEEAIGSFGRALRFRADFVPALRGRAHALVHLGRNEEALDAFDQVLALAPKDVWSLTNRAVALANLSRCEEALTSAKKAMSLRPDDPHAAAALGTVLRRMGRMEEALPHLERAAAARPRDLAVQVALGRFFLDSGDYAKAIEVFDLALKTRMGSTLVRTFRAMAIGQLGDNDQAARELEAVLRDRPDYEPARRWLVRFGGAEKAQELVQEQVEEQERRQQEQRDREMKFDAWRKLSARTAHRVGNQLFAAKGAMRALASDMSAEHAEAISDIQACMDRIGLLCSELKRFSAEQPPKPKPTDVPALVQEVVRRLTGSAEGIELRASVPSLLPECRWDGQQIDQAMTELLENAIRHTPKGKAIEVSAEPFEQGRRQYVRLTVRNEGDGVEGPYKDRIFEPFFSLRPGGTGLGLAIVWQIIKNHKGSIRETGEPGRFARFVIELPARPFEERSDESPGD